MAALLGVLGHRVPSGRGVGGQEPDGDAIRNSLPPLRVLADVVDAKPETVCRALAQLLPPRARKTGPRKWSKASQAAAQAMAEAKLQGQRLKRLAAAKKPRQPK